MLRRSRKIALIGVATGWGALRRETEEGAHKLQSLGLAKNLQNAGIDAYWKTILMPSQSAKEITFIDPFDALELINQVNKDLSQVVSKTLKDGEFPVVLGGDHTVAVGTWGAVTTTLEMVKKFGLLWVDAHMDAHTRETSSSHAFHGMPVAALLGYGDLSFMNVVGPGAKIRPEHLTLIGVRSYEKEEQNLLKSLNVRVIDMTSIQQKGFSTSFKSALAQIKTETKGFGVSIDLDAFDPQVAPGVGTPAPEGLFPQDVLSCLQGLGHDPLLKGLEIVELNPSRDYDDKTAHLVQTILMSLFSH